jgi:AbrB family looped-hinge helix DNA binding protein
MSIARVTTKGQVTIPIEIRKALDIRTGDQLLFELLDSCEARVRVVKNKSLMDLYGILPATRPFPGKEAIRDDVGKMLGGHTEKQMP